MTEQGGRGFSPAGLRFHSILAAVEAELQLALSRARAESGHGGTIGDGAEAAVRQALHAHLPSGYGVGHGHVYDAYGDGSRQTDVIVTSPEHPLSYDRARPGSYLVDGVAAAGEVKVRLDATALDDCIAKGRAFKQLRMTLNHGDDATPGEGDYLKQIGLVPPYFAVVFENKVAEHTIGERLQAAGLVSPPPGKSLGEDDWADAPQPPLDAICILGQGVWIYLRPNNRMGLAVAVEQSDGSITARREVENGWVFLQTSAGLAWLLAWLSASMPRIVRGRPVLSPYLLPPVRHVKYMSRGDEG